MAWQDKIRNPKCRLCPLHEGADHVCLMGTGSRKAEIMVVGEAPGQREDEKHAAFVGPAGRLLRSLLKDAGISPIDCYITNVVKCRPPDNRTPELSEIKACSTAYLNAEAVKVRPRWVLLLGNSALRGVVGRSGITKHRGSTFDLPGNATAFATFHPAYALRNPKHLEPLKADLRRFGQMVRGEEAGPSLTRTRIIRSKRGLKDLRDHLAEAKVISFDIETTYDWERKRYHQPWDEGAGIINIAFTTEPGQSYFVPLYHESSPWKDKWREVLKYFKEVLEREDVKTVAHNGKFDCKWLAWFGVYIKLTFDTMLAAHLLEENRRKGLEELASVLLGAQKWKEPDKKGFFSMEMKRLARYAGRDTDYTLRLYWLLRKQLIEQPRLARIFLHMMMPASDVLTRVETVGMYVHSDRLEKQYKYALKQREKTLKKLRKHVPKYSRNIINFNSTQQLAHWLFTDLKLPILERTGKGAPSTKESVLLQLAKKHPAAKLLLEYRKWKKQLEFLESWREKVDVRNRIHTVYKLFGTVTGRLSSEEPNLQQVPREGTMRTCFGAPPGWYFVEADYSQIELRIAALLSDDRTLLRAFATDEDVHTKTASKVSGKPPDTITKEQRKKAKAVNFGFLYDMGAAKFVSYARDNYDVEFSIAEAQRVRRTFFETYSSLRPWHERQRRRVEQYGHVVSPFGRVRHLPDVYSSDTGVKREAERQAINSPVQSCASDLMLLSLVRLATMLRSGQARIVGTVHDALLFEVKEDALEEVVPIIKTVMEDMDTPRKMFGAHIDVPIKVEITYGKYWGDPDAKEWK